MSDKACGCKIKAKSGEMEVPKAVGKTLQKRGGFSVIEKELLSNERFIDQAKVFKALSDPNRIKILHLLGQQDLCVCLLREFIDMSNSKLSYHINILKDNELITGEREGNFIIYHLTKKGQKFI